MLEGDETLLDHVHDALPRCRHIMEIAQTNIDRGIFPDGSEVREVLDDIMKEARETLMYWRQCQRTWVEEVEEPDEH